jgi:hypothetical protein
VGSPARSTSTTGEWFNGGKGLTVHFLALR